MLKKMVKIIEMLNERQHSEKHSEEREAVNSGMSFKINSALRNVIAFAAIANIVALMVFQYGLPSNATKESGSNSKDYSSEESSMGTIESVEQETAAKEEEEAQTALAREEEPYESEEPAEERDPEAPILELIDDHIYLKVGDRFNYMSYIKTMEDVDGSDLSHYIYLDKDVDTSEPGEIELTYRITSVITGKSVSKVLLITIRE